MILLQSLTRETGTAEPALSCRQIQIYSGSSRIGVSALDAK
jgi:hypothetical protein